MEELSVFRPNLGGVVYQGDQISSLYDPVYTNFSPRVGVFLPGHAEHSASCGRRALL